MTQPLQERTLRSARAAVFALFASFGIVLSTWAVHLPVLKQSVEMSNAMTGTVLLILGIGSLAGMQLSGVAIDRWGTERVAVTAGAALGVSIVVPLTATTIGQAGIGALVLGISAGCADVGMNAAAVDVERDYGRPIMAAFHAVFSIGTVIGSLLGSAGFALQLTTLTTTSVTASLCLLTVGAACAGFRGYRASRDLTSDDVAVSPTQFDRRYRRVLLLGMLAFLLFLSEGSAMDWSSLHARQHLGGALRRRPGRTSRGTGVGAAGRSNTGGGRHPGRHHGSQSAGSTGRLGVVRARIGWRSPAGAHRGRKSRRRINTDIVTRGRRRLRSHPRRSGADRLAGGTGVLARCVPGAVGFGHHLRVRRALGRTQRRVVGPTGSVGRCLLAVRAWPA
jgi:MFS family permease